MDKTRTPA